MKFPNTGLVYAFTGSRPLILAAIVVALVSSCATHVPSGRTVGLPEEAHILTISIIDGIDSCSDVWSKPDYYATVLRRDPVISEELRSIRLKSAPLSSRIREIRQIVNPLDQRKHNTERLSDESALKLKNLSEQAQELTERIRKTEVEHNEKRELELELDEVTAAVESLENRRPLNREEILLLNENQKELAVLIEEQSQLDSRRDVLLPLVVMRTPGSLRVYPNDSLQIRLMEKDVQEDDICATWNLVLDEKILNLGLKFLSKWGTVILRVTVEPEIS